MRLFRLAGVNVPEANTPEGKRVASARAVREAGAVRQIALQWVRRSAA